MTNVDDFKGLERHPLSADYKDLAGKARKRLKAGMEKFGFLPDRPVVLAPDAQDGGKTKILDGWQRHTIALELGIEPVYRQLPEGVLPEAYVEAANDARRHESPELTEKRIKERVARIAKLYKEGKSVRSVAEEEGISKSQAQRDREAAESAGLETTPATGKSTGKDGKARPAGGKPIFCKRCTRVGARPNCKDCAKLRAAKKGKKKVVGPAIKNGTPVYDFRKFRDGFGIVVREVDVVAKQYGCKDAPHINKLHDMLREFKVAFEVAVRKSREDALEAQKQRVAAAKAAEAIPV